MNVRWGRVKIKFFVGFNILLIKLQGARQVLRPHPKEKLLSKIHILSHHNLRRDFGFISGIFGTETSDSSSAPRSLLIQVARRNHAVGDRNRDRCVRDCDSAFTVQSVIIKMYNLYYFSSYFDCFQWCSFSVLFNLSIFKLKCWFYNFSTLGRFFSFSIIV